MSQFFLRSTSMKNKKLLTFEITPDGEEIEIHCDEQGAQDLILYIQRMLGSTKPQNHEHLSTPTWAGDELTEEKQGENNKLINQVTVHIWNND